MIYDRGVLTSHERNAAAKTAGEFRSGVTLAAGSRQANASTGGHEQTRLRSP